MITLELVCRWCEFWVEALNITTADDRLLGHWSQNEEVELVGVAEEGPKIGRMIRKWVDAGSYLSTSYVTPLLEVFRGSHSHRSLASK
jgi:hypothetical protein